MDADACNDAVVSADNLKKIFRDFWRRPKKLAVDGVSFAIRKGEVFGLLGPNGSGKSTTIKMLLGLLQPTSGAVRLFGLDPASPRAKARIGYLPELSHFHPCAFMQGGRGRNGQQAVLHCNPVRLRLPIGANNGRSNGKTRNRGDAWQSLTPETV